MNPLLQLIQNLQTNARALILPIGIAVFFIVVIVKMVSNAVPAVGRHEGSIWAVMGLVVLGLLGIPLMTWVASLGGGG
jgi:hypothetical protein